MRKTKAQILKQQIRREIRKELLITEGVKGSVIGYIVGVIVDFLMKRKNANSQSKEVLTKDVKARLEKRYNDDPKFRQIVDDLVAGKKVV